MFTGKRYFYYLIINEIIVIQIIGNIDTQGM